MRDDIETCAARDAGNWQRFDSFGLHDDSITPLDAILYTHHRDSTLLDISNHAAILKALAPFKRDAREISCNHWAVGHVDGFAIRVYRRGKITDAYRMWHELQTRIADYPVLDESDYSERECNATWENVCQQTRYVARKFDIEYTDELASRVERWLSDNCPRALESRDDSGGYPDDDEIEDALLGIGELVEETETTTPCTSAPNQENDR